MKILGLGVSLHLLMFTLALSQPATEVYLFDLAVSAQEFSLSNPTNVSQNPGYDNQPSFLPDGESLLFVSTRDGQTDIVRYHIDAGSKTWLTQTAGGEYSPQLIPNTQRISAVRLDPDGTQLLYSYPLEGGEGEVLVPEVKIGYYAWLSSKKYLAFVLGEPATLRTGKVKKSKTKILKSDIGRSVHATPYSSDITYVKHQSEGKRIIARYDLKRKVDMNLLEPMEGSQDMVWLSDEILLMGQGTKLFMGKVNGDWKEVADIEEMGLGPITRLAVNKERTQIAIVTEEKKSASDE